MSADRELSEDYDSWSADDWSGSCRSD